MTRTFDVAAAAAVDAQPTLFGRTITGDEHPRDLVVHPCPVSFARGHIARGHYSGSMPDSTKEVFAGFYGQALAGIVVFGMGANHNQYTALVPDIGLGRYRELTRLWVDDRCPPNTASRLVSDAISQLPDEVELLVSYADSEQGHVGFVYQALNFLFCGTTSESTRLVDRDGNPVHPRLVGIYRMRRPELADLTGPEICRRMGWTKVRSHPKFRYVMLRGPRSRRRQMMRTVADHVVTPYPKEP